MTQERERVTTVAVPWGYCRACRDKVLLDPVELPKVTRNRRLLIKGFCDNCQGAVTTLYTPSPLERLPVKGLAQVTVALVSIGMVAGMRRASSFERDNRGDEMLRLQAELNLTHRQLGRIFNLSVGRVATVLGAARRRKQEREVA